MTTKEEAFRAAAPTFARIIARLEAEAKATDAKPAEPVKKAS